MNILEQKIAEYFGFYSVRIIKYENGTLEIEVLKGVTG